LKNVCFEIGERYCFEFDAIDNYGDHNHLLVDTESKYSPSRVVQIIKSITVRQTIKGYPAIKNSLGVVNYEVIEDKFYFLST